MHYIFRKPPELIRYDKNLAARPRKQTRIPPKSFCQTIEHLVEGLGLFKEKKPHKTTRVYKIE